MVLPFYAVQAFDLQHEVSESPEPTWEGPSGNQAKTRDVINKDRDCDERGYFIRWMQGFTPKEHSEIRESNANVNGG